MELNLIRNSGLNSLIFKPHHSIKTNFFTVKCLAYKNCLMGYNTGANPMNIYTCSY